MACEKARVIAERLAAAFEKVIIFNDQPLQVGVSIGVNVLSPETHSIDLALKNADQAMYQAKQSSTEKICFYK